MKEITQLKAKLSPERMALLQKIIGSNSDSDLSAIPRRSGEGRIPLSFAQQRLWFLDQLVPDNPAYNTVIAFHLTGHVNNFVLERSINEIVRRHEVLRTTYQSENGQSYQVIASSLHIPLPVYDWSTLESSEQQLTFRELADEEGRFVFNLSNGPLLRVKLCHLGVDQWIILLNIHHISIDGWSMGILLKELVVLYKAFISNSSSPLPDLTIQYADFAIWQREWTKGNEFDRQLAYWKERLGSGEELMELPTDRTRPPIQTFKGGSLKFELPTELSTLLKELGEREHVTLYMVLLTALKVVLHRYSGQTNIIVGSPIANRNHIEIESLIGFFVNSLVLKTDVSGDPTFLELLSRVKDTANGAYQNQDVPFELLVDELKLARNLSQNPLFQVCFVLQNIPMPKNTEMTDLDFTLDQFEDIRNDTSKFDLWIQAKDTGSSLWIDVEYNADIFDESTAWNMMDSFRIMLQGIASDPKQPISRYPILSTAETYRLLQTFNDTSVVYSEQNQCLDELLASQAQRTPDSPAIRFENCELTYRELDRRANKLAHYLKNKGFGTDALIGICLERSIDMVVALLGVLKAGSAYVPLDPDYPLERLSYLVADAYIPLLITQSKLIQGLPVHTSEVVCLDTDWDSIEEETEEPVTVERNGSHLAYMIYTSGSTGKPKGSLNTHHSIVNRLLWMQQTYSLNGSDRVLQKTPYSFDVSVWEFFWPLLTGACLVLAKPGGHKDPSYLTKLIREERITTLHFVPSMLQVFLEEQDVSSCTSLKRVICSGESLPYTTQERFFDRLQAELHNLYGPTEAAVDVTAWSCEKGSERKTVPIGKPIANTQIYILDQYLQPVPVGVPGEIHIGGVQVSRGYYRRPELTAERFFPDPFSGVQDARLYKTGDLAKFRPDGNIEYLGRIDFQVKVRGFRIEPEEIESVLEEHPGVQKAVVSAYSQEHTPDYKQLVAWIVPDAYAQELVNGGSVDTLPDAQVSEWETVFEKAYETNGQQNVNETNAGFNISSWNSSYTGEPLLAEEMGEWVESTVERIFSIQPKRVLEIGCGTGLLLSRIAPYCQRYWGTDISGKALEHITNLILRGKEEMSHVSLSRTNAEDFSPLTGESFDTVILNSVVQYFPDITYLKDVIAQGVRLIASQGDGAIFVGDVRNLSLLELFHSEVELEKADRSLMLPDWKVRLQKRVSQEQELVIDPDFFHALQMEYPEICHVHIQMKRGAYHNELTRYRYDVILYIGSVPPVINIREWEKWRKEELNFEQFKQRITNDLPEVLAISGIANNRLDFINQGLKLLTQEEPFSSVGEWIHQINKSQSTEGWDPEEVWEYCIDMGYNVNLHWSDHDSAYGCFNLVLRRQQLYAGSHYFSLLVATPSVKPRHSWGEYGNNPLLDRISRRLVGELRSFAKEKLPDHMLPAHYTFLKHLPLGPNGKLDRKSLPDPILESIGLEVDFAEATTETETILSEIWAEVLGLNKVGIHHNFFGLGGDSIHSIRVVARAKQRGIELTPQFIFQYQTIYELAGVYEGMVGLHTLQSYETVGEFSYTERDKLRVMELCGRSDIEDVYPLASFQSHMLDRYLKSPDQGLFLVQNMMISPHEGDLDIELIRRVWQHLVERHPLLRTSFEWEDLDQPLQLVHEYVPVSLDFEDWRTLSELDKDQRLEDFLQNDRTIGIDLNMPRGIRLFVGQMEDSILLLLSFSYMCLDGWSFNTIFEEMDEIMTAFAKGEDLRAEIPQSFGDCVAMIQQEGLLESEEYWHRSLQNHNLPETFAHKIAGNLQNEESGFARQCIVLSLQISDRLRSIARENQLTLGTLMQGVWSFLQSYHSGEENVTYGLLVNGRPVHLPGIEKMVGPFLNILPLLVNVPQGEPVLHWLKQLMFQVNEVSKHQNTPLRKLQDWGLIPTDVPFAENYLVFQNVTSDELNARTTNHFFVSKMGFPLRVDIYPDREIGLHMSYYRNVFNDKSISTLIAGFHQLLEKIAYHSESLYLRDLNDVVRNAATSSLIVPQVFYEGEFRLEDIRSQMLDRV